MGNSYAIRAGAGLHSAIGPGGPLDEVSDQRELSSIVYPGGISPGYFFISNGIIINNDRVLFGVLS